MLKTYKKQLRLGLTLLAMLGSFLVFSSSAHAATFTVATGTDENTDNSSCSLSEAIENINDGADTNTDCSPTGSYGTDDTINIPAGTITLIQNLEILTNPATITGAGMGQTTLDGDNGQYQALSCVGAPGPLTVRDMTVTAYNTAGVGGQSCSLDVARVEIDGTNAQTSVPVMAGIIINGGDGGSHTYTIEDVYIHSINTSVDDIGPNGILVGGVGSTQLYLDFSRITISDITSSGGDTGAPGAPGISGINILTGIIGDMSAATITGSITNVTISDMTSTQAGVSGIAIFGVVNGGTTDIDLDISHITVSELSGAPVDQFGTPVGVLGLIVATGALGNGDEVNASIDTQNLLLAGSSGEFGQYNCMSGDVTTDFGGLGTATIVTTSGGGNLSSDDTCTADFFTDASDQNNVGNLISTLGTLSDNGGYVPTIPLLVGSPAIDSGIDLTGIVDVDARGVARPQLSAYDSGAYEVTQAELDAQAVEDEDAIPGELANTGQQLLNIHLTTFGLLTSLLILGNWVKRAPTQA